MNNVLVNKSKYNFLIGRIVLLIILVIFNRIAFEDYFYNATSNLEIIRYILLLFVLNMIIIYYFLNMKLVYYIEILSNNMLLLKYVNYSNILGLKSVNLEKDKIVIEEEMTISLGGARKYININYNKDKFILSNRFFIKEDYQHVREELRKFASNQVLDGWKY